MKVQLLWNIVALLTACAGSSLAGAGPDRLVKEVQKSSAQHSMSDTVVPPGFQLAESCKTCEHDFLSLLLFDLTIYLQDVQRSKNDIAARNGWQKAIIVRLSDEFDQGHTCSAVA
ncbi:hypothetical protein C8J56DRAFT_917186 [Mycena floridula]|nr:hypothetical protein C8J56DRAFT_917186 [Mycena floridula]